MKEIETVVTDLDGTLAHDHKITDEDRLALDRVLSAGIPVITVTTRMRCSASSILKGTGVADHPGVCLNGAHILGPGWESSDCKELYGKELDMNVATSIADYADEKDYEITTIFKEKKYWKKRRDRGADLLEEDKVAVLVDRNSQAIENEPPISFMMHSEINGRVGLKDMEDFVQKSFSDRTTIHRHHRLGEWVAITVYPSEINKGSALEILSDLDILDLETVLAIGNDHVDLPMIEIAGMGIAMEDSPEEVKKRADDIAPSCLKSGFSWAMNHYVLK